MLHWISIDFGYFMYNIGHIVCCIINYTYIFERTKGRNICRYMYSIYIYIFVSKNLENYFIINPHLLQITIIDMWMPIYLITWFHDKNNIANCKSCILCFAHLEHALYKYLFQEKVSHKSIDNVRIMKIYRPNSYLTMREV